MFTPASILKTWKRVNDRFGLVGDDAKDKDKGKEKKPSAKAKQAEKEDARVNKRLMELRVLGKGDLSEPATGKRFLKSRDKAAKAMKKYCKLLKSNDLKGDVQDLNKFRKAVKQLVVVVEMLEARPYPDDAEGGDGDLTALDKVDTAALDKAMEDPKFGEYSDAELDQDEPETEAATTTAKPTADPAAEWKARLAEWSPAIKAAMAAKGPKAADMAKLLAQSTALAKPGGDMPLAMEKLTECYKLATGGAAPTQGKPTSTDPAAEWKARLTECSPAIKAAMAAKGPKAADMAKLLAQATALSKPGGDMAQALEKLTECHNLATASAAPAAPSDDPAALFKQRLQAFQPAFKAALAQARSTDPDRAEDLDGLFAQMFDEAKAKKFEKALGTLDVLTRMVSAGPKARASEAPTAEPGPETKTKTGFVNYAKARLDWVSTRTKVSADLKKLEKAILEFYKDSPSFAVAKASTRKLDSVLQNLDETLADKLDQGLNAADDAARSAINKEAAAIIDNYVKYLTTDPLVTQLDDNPFVPLSVQDDLSKTLSNLAAQVS